MSTKYPVNYTKIVTLIIWLYLHPFPRRRGRVEYFLWRETKSEYVITQITPKNLNIFIFAGENVYWGKMCQIKGRMAINPVLRRI
jgi:hypothetical protein